MLCFLLEFFFQRLQCPRRPRGHGLHRRPAVIQVAVRRWAASGGPESENQSGGASAGGGKHRHWQDVSTEGPQPPLGGAQWWVSLHRKWLKGELQYYSWWSGARRLSPQALSRWPHASDPGEPSSCRRSRIWPTGRCVSRSLFSERSGAFQIKPIILQVLTCSVKWEGRGLTGAFICPQVIYPLKDIYPLSGITALSCKWWRQKPRKVIFVNIEVFFMVWASCLRRSGRPANCSVSGTGRSGQYTFLTSSPYYTPDLFHLSDTCVFQSSLLRRTGGLDEEVDWNW